MSFITDLWNSIHAIATSADAITLVIAVVIVLAAGYMLESLNGLITTTVLALLAFALAGYVRAVTVGGQNASAYATTDWHNFLALPMLTLLSYAVAFAVVIAVVHLVRTLIAR